MRNLLLLTALLAATAALPARADESRTYEVTITNVTRGQTFTPQLVATHTRRADVFELGRTASEALEILAEGGDTGPLTDVLLGAGPAVGDVQTNGGLLGPGESVTITLSGMRRHRYLSMAAMLIPTNDTFVALDTVRLPLIGTRQMQALAYDAGTEGNDQNCANIPGPRCGGEGVSVGVGPDDEGYVYVSNGFHDLGVDDGAGNEVLGPLVYDWRNPVALVTVRRTK